MTAIWPRPRFMPGGGAARFRFLCFLEAPIAGAVDLRAEGWVRAGFPEGVALAGVERPLDPDNEALISGFVDWLGDHPLAARVGATRFIVAVEGVVSDPEDLGYLQAAWAAVRWVCRNGALGVWDMLASMWHDASEVLARPPGAGDLACATGIGTHPAGGGLVVAHTVGMCKVGRRDLVAFAAPEAADDVTRLLAELTDLQVSGVRLDAGERLERDGLLLRLEGYAPGFNGPPIDVEFVEQPLLVTIATG
jgi:hypothetical protein